MYYQRHELQKRYTLFFSGAIVASAFGGLFAYALVKMNGIGGYEGWRWIFIMEGIITVFLGVGTKFLLADRPEDAKFLREDEKALLKLKLAREGTDLARMDRLTPIARKRIWTDWKIYVGIA